jgi:hypothetical protein
MHVDFASRFGRLVGHIVKRVALHDYPEVTIIPNVVNEQGEKIGADPGRNNLALEAQSRCTAPPSSITCTGDRWAGRRSRMMCRSKRFPATSFRYPCSHRLPHSIDPVIVGVLSE